MAEHLNSSQKDPTVDDFFYLLSQTLIYELNADKANDAFVGPFNKIQQKQIFKTESQQQLFSHICNYSVQMHWGDDKDPVPNGFLNVDVTKAQHRLFNPTFKNVLAGFIMYDVKGEGAKKKLERRQLDLIEGDVARYSRFMNRSKMMEAMKNHHELSSAVADISDDQDQDKANRKKEEFDKFKAKE